MCFHQERLCSRDISTPRENESCRPLSPWRVHQSSTCHKQRLGKENDHTRGTARTTTPSTRRLDSNMATYKTNRRTTCSHQKTSLHTRRACLSSLGFLVASNSGNSCRYLYYYHYPCRYLYYYHQYYHYQQQDL